MGPYRILLHNIGYTRGFTGGPLLSDLQRASQLLYGKDMLRSQLHDQLYSYIEQEQPDVCCFVEVHDKADFSPLLHEYPYYDCANKYGQSSVLRRTPFYRNNCNGFFSRNEVHFLRHYLRSGQKKLLYELHLPGEVTLLLGHFALQKSVRMRQFAEVAQLVAHRERVILCGDFNIFSGEEELHPFIHQCGLQIADTNATFPAARPSRMIDLFLHSPDIQVHSCRVLEDIHVSDHLPVLLEFSP